MADPEPIPEGGVPSDKRNNKVILITLAILLVIAIGIGKWAGNRPPADAANRSAEKSGKHPAKHP